MKRKRSAALEAADLLDQMKRPISVAQYTGDLQRRLRAEHRELVRMERVVELETLTGRQVSKQLYDAWKRIERRRARK